MSNNRPPSSSRPPERRPSSSRDYDAFDDRDYRSSTRGSGSSRGGSSSSRSSAPSSRSGSGAPRGSSSSRPPASRNTSSRPSDNRAPRPSSQRSSSSSRPRNSSKKRRRTSPFVFLLPIVVVLALVAALVLTLRSFVFTDKDKTEYTLDFSHQTIVVGSTATVKLSGLPEDSDAKVTWSSSEVSIVTVNDGTLTAKKVGTATISATVNRKNISGTVKVIETAEGVKSLTLTPGSIKIISGKTAQLDYDLRFEDDENAPAVSPTWSTTNPAVASVTDGLVTARDVGTATITATVGDKSGTCTVTVEEDTNGQPAGSDEGTQPPEEPVEEPSVPPAGGDTPVTPPTTPPAADTGTANNTNNTTNNGNTGTATNNSNAGTSDNTGNTGGNDTGGDNTGTSPPAAPPAVSSLGLSQGTAYLDVGDNLALEAYVSPSGASVTWTSSDPAVATVSAGGVVNAKGAGSVVITATAGGVFTFCTIDVAAPEPVPEAPVPEGTAIP